MFTGLHKQGQLCVCVCVLQQSQTLVSVPREAGKHPKIRYFCSVLLKSSKNNVEHRLES